MTAWAKACGASCGRLCPTPPVMSRCAYRPENFFAYAPGSRCGAPLASPSRIIVDHDADVIRVFEGRCTPIECRVIEIPLRRSKPPDELVKIVPVFVVACAAAFGGKIKL